MDDLPVSLDDYRDLAAFLEQQIAETSVTAPRAVEELRARLAALHGILAQADAVGDQAEQLLHDQFEAEAFELKMKQRPPSKAAFDTHAQAPAAPPAASVEAPPRSGAGGTLDELEALVTKNPGDDELRKRYVELAESQSCQVRAAETLRGVFEEASRPDVRERVGLDVALLYLGEGELPQARSALLGVVTAGAGGPAALAAARRLLNLQVDPSDPELVGPAREILAKADPDPAQRREAAEGLLALHAKTPQKDARLAVAYRALVGQVDAARTTEALAWLRRFYAKSGQSTGLVEWLEHAEHWEELARVIEGDLDLAPAREKSRQLAHLGEIKLVRLGDAPGALAAFSRALAVDPIGTADTALAAMTRAHAALRDRDRHDLMLRIARALSRKGQGPRALGLCRELFIEPSVEPAAVQEIADIAHDEDDNDLYRHALEHLSRVGDEDSRKKALERLGDFQFAQMGDKRAAAESWRPAARLYDAAPADKEQAQVLYERVLEAIPNDRDAAGRLAEMYAEASDWAKLPDVLRVLVASKDEPERTSRLLLGLEKSAVEAGEVGEYVSLVGGLLVGALAADAKNAPGTPESALALKKARARVLASDPARFAEAAAAHRDVIESSMSDDDVRAFEAFLEAGPSAEERLHERRWLYERRVAHGPRPAETLLEWAKAEEELGESEAAVALYVRLSKLAPSQREGLEALCRLKLHASDFEGGLAALRSLREIGSDEERRAVTLQMARVLLEDLGRPAEAALALAPLLDVVPPLPAARQLMRKALADPAAREEVAESVERLAKGDDRVAARRVFQFLVDARDETAALAGARRRWFERLVELSAPDARAVLSASVRGAVEQPDAMALWDHAERAAREVGQAEVVVKAYRDALVERVTSAELAETLAQRMIAFAGDFALPDATRLIEALQRLLEIVPSARWALDRVKLVLGSAARWDELFVLYDRAIAATTDDTQRADLLDEAARAAKDVAGAPERAIPYLEAIHRLRPTDGTVSAALERAYERQGRTRALIDLLGESLGGPAAAGASVAPASGFKRRETLQRIASLWLDLGGAGEALGLVEKSIAEGASVSDLAPCLERIAGDPAAPADGPAKAPLAPIQQRAVAMLRAHYEQVGQAEDVVRMASRQLSLAEGTARSRSVRDLKTLLSRGTKLALEKPRRRDLLRDAAVAAAARPGDREHAIALFAALFEEDAGDEAAARCVEAYGALLEATEQPATLARLWEEQARIHGAAERPAEQRACWDRAAAVWRRQGARAEAIAAYRQAAALSSESAFEGLAALHEESRDWGEAAAALEWLYAHTPAAARGQRALRLAEAYVALGDRARARGALEHALDAGVEPERLEAVSDALVALYRGDGAWRPLADRLVASATRTKDADKKLALLREAAELLRTKVGAPAEAAALLEKAVSLRPADASLRPALADVLEAVERWERLVEVLKEQLGLQGAPRTKERAWTHHRLARAMVRAGRPKDALAELRAAAEMLPAHPSVLNDLARAALEVGQLDLAESTFRALLLALHHPPDDAGTPPPHRAEVFLDLSEIAVRKTDVARANDLVDSAVDVAFETGEPPERFEPVLASRGRFDLLARSIERRVERAPTLAARAAALGALARTWVEHLKPLGRPELEARVTQHTARIARELEHDGGADVDGWSALASVHDALGDEAARAATEQRLVVLLEEAIGQAAPGPARAKLRATLGKALLHTSGGTDAAISALSAALDDDPQAAGAAELLGATLAGLAAARADWDGAIEGYRKVLSVTRDPGTYARFASELADACEKAGRPEDAREALERALAEFPESAPLTQRLARICEKNGDFARLARLADTLRAKNPENLEAVLLWALALRGLSRAGEALAGLTAAIERCRGKRSPLLARLLLEAARAHLAVDELVEAFEQLKAAYGMDAKNAEIAMLLALVAVDLDDERTAERALFTVTAAAARTDADRHSQATAFYHLATMAHAKGDGAKARRLAGKALSLEPGLPAAQALLERLDSSGSAVVPRSSVGASVRPPADRAAVTPRS